VGELEKSGEMERYGGGVGLSVVVNAAQSCLRQDQALHGPVGLSAGRCLHVTSDRPCFQRTNSVGNSPV
jgi:hypothetical protein